MKTMNKMNNKTNENYDNYELDGHEKYGNIKIWKI